MADRAGNEFPHLSHGEAVYRSVTSTVEGFVQQVAVNLLPHGYRFYVTGVIPEHKDPAALDTKLIERYGLNLSKWARARRKKHGQARVQYLRHGRFFLLIATDGEDAFFSQETTIRDIRRVPLHCFGYSVGVYQRPDGSWHPSVRMAAKVFESLKEELCETALRCSADVLEEKIRRLPFAPFAPVRNQVLTLLRLVNQRRKVAGFSLVAGECVRRRRKPVQVFTDSVDREPAGNRGEAIFGGYQ